MKYHKLSGLKKEIYCLTVLETRSGKSRYSQRHDRMKPVGESFLPLAASGGLLAISALLHSNPQLSHGFFLFVSAYIRLSAFRDASHIRLG